MKNVVKQYSASAIITNVGRQLSARPFDAICEVLFVFFASWALVWVLAYSLNATFASLPLFFFSLFPLSLIPLAFKPKPKEGLNEPKLEGALRETLFVFLFVLIGVLLTLVLHRPDADDELYLNIAVSLLANAERPVRESLGLLGGSTYALAAYEPLKAIVSYITGMPLLYSYYLVIPAIMSSLVVIVSQRLLRMLLDDGWIFGMLFFFVIMLTWGDVHRTHANFGFVRMFQGKAVLVSAVVPAIIFYFLRFRAQMSLSYDAFFLFVVIVAGIGASRGGLLIGPMLALLLGLCSLKRNSPGRIFKAVSFAFFLSAVVVLPFVYFYGWTFNEAQLVHTPRGAVEATTNYEMLQFTIGEGFRGFFLLACVAISFVFVGDHTIRYPYRNFIFLFLLLLLIPGTSNFFGKTIHQFMSWRWTWIFPIPVLAGVSLGGGIQWLRQKSSTGLAWASSVVVAIVLIMSGPRRVVSEENYTAIRWPRPKLDRDEIVLRPKGTTATIRDGRLYMEDSEIGY